MLVRLLGPVELVGAAGPVRLGGDKQRTALAVLALSNGRAVDEQRLIACLWDESPPRTATKTVQTYIARLRSTLGEAISTTPSGYRLDAEVDVAAVGELVRDGRALMLDGDLARATERFDQALEHWSGTPLSGVADTRAMALERTGLEELRYSITEERVDALLGQGQHSRLISELELLVGEEPLRERRWGQLLLALYRSGRQSDALRAYQRLRATLAEELGIDPADDLRELERRILARDPSLELASSATATRAGSRSTPDGAVGLPSGVVTFLLTDVVGSTEMWDREPRRMDDAIARHDDLIDRVVATNNGRLLKTKGEGDATFSVFTRATDAVTPAIACHQRLAREAWPDGIELQVRWAIATGEAVERDGDYYGTAVNRAARLRSLAGGGDVMVAQSTVDLVIDHLPDGIQLVDMGEQVLRGLRRPERVWQAVSAHDHTAPGTLDAPAAGTSATPTRSPLPPVLAAAARRPFVARIDELSRITELIQGRGGRLIWVRGEPGIGKTRLVAEAAHIAHDEGHIVLFGRCDDLMGAPYQPFVEALRGWVSSATSGEVAEIVGRQRHQIARLVPELATGPVTSTPASDGDQYLMFEAVDEMLTRLSSHAPVLVVLDDLHWAGQSSLLLLRHLVRSARDRDIVVLATYRDTDLDRTHPLADVLADLRRDTPDERIDLTGLDASATVQLMEALGADLDADRLSAIVAETEGNPFFATEIARHFAEAGTGLGVPEGIRDAIGRRLSRLSPLVNEALSIAAVIGRDFDAEVLVASGGPRDQDLDEALEIATAAHLLDEVPGTFGRYRFGHALVRQTLLAELSANRLVRLHWTAGQALAELRPHDLDAIAHHLAEGVLAGDPLVAADASLAAANAALVATAWDEAAGHFEQGLEILDQAAADAPRLRYTALMGISESRRMLREFGAPRRAALAAVEVAREQGWRDELVTAGLQVATFEAGGLRPRTQAVLEEALDLLEDPDCSAALLVECALTTAQGRGRAMEEAQWNELRTGAVELVDRADRVGDLNIRVRARYALATALSGRARSRELSERAAEMRSLLDREHPPGTPHEFAHGIATTLMGAGFEAADPDMLSDGLRRDAELLAAQDSPWLRRAILWATSNDALASGRFDEFDAHVDDLVGDQDRAYELVHWDLTTRRAFVAGDLGRAVGALTEVVELGTPYAEIEHLLAAALAAAGRVPDARAASTAAWARGFHFGYGRPRALSAAAEAAVRLDDTVAAEALLPMLVPYDGTILAPYQGFMVDVSAATALGQVETALGRFDDAVEHFRVGAEIEQRMGWEVLVARTQVWWARALRSRARVGDRGEAERLLRVAESTGERLGIGLVLRDVASTREALT
jgi:DNA-binding SARP family transcriptional activator